MDDDDDDDREEEIRSRNDIIGDRARDAARINLGLISSSRTVLSLSLVARDDHGSRGERRYQFQLSNRDASGKSEGYERPIKEETRDETFWPQVNFNKTGAAQPTRGFDQIDPPP